MFRKFALMMAGFVLPFSFVAVTAESASADTPGCVSDGEYQNTEPGEKMSDLQARYDTDGLLTSTRFDDGGRYQIKRYLKCYESDAFGSYVRVEFFQNIVGGELSGPNTVVRKWRSTS